MRAGSIFNWKTAAIVAVLPFGVAWLQGDPAPAAGGETNSIITPIQTEVAPGADTPATIQLTNVLQLPPPSPPPGLQLYGGTQEVVKMAQAGIGDDVILTYITNSTAQFGVTPDEIIYLNDLGVSGTVATAMMKHDAAANAVASATAATVAAATAGASPIAPSLAPAPVQAPGAYYTNPPVPPPDDISMANPPPEYPNDTDYNMPYPGDDSTGSDAGYFYNSLVPYGLWVYVPGTGICWQPTVCLRDHSWRPYCDRGRWLYSNCGWYWQSDYSWGWAAFHYGRWFCDSQHGWMWQPNRVWSPAWVAWRVTPDHSGWAPLPPKAVFIPGIGFQVNNQAVASSSDFGLPAAMFIFIPTERMGDYAPSRYKMTTSETEQAFNDSKPLSSVTIVNQRVANLGIDPRIVDAREGVPVRRAVIQEVQGTDANGRVQPDRLGRRGGSLVIYRPQLPPPATRQGTMPTTGTHMPPPGTTFAAPTMTSPARTPAVLGQAANSTVQPSAGNVSHLQVYYATHQDPAPASPVSWYTPGQPRNTTTPTTAARTYPPNSMVLVGQRNLTSPQETQSPAGTASYTYHPGSTAVYTVAPANSYAGYPQNYGNENYGNGYYRSPVMPSMPGSETRPAAGYDYHPSGLAPVQQEPSYRPAPEPRNNYPVQPPQENYSPAGRETYPAQTPREGSSGSSSYSSRSSSYSQPSSPASSSQPSSSSSSPWSSSSSSPSSSHGR